MSRTIYGASTALLHNSSGNHIISYGTNERTRTNGQYRRSSHSTRWRFMMAIGVGFFMVVIFLFVRAAVTILQDRKVSRTKDFCDSLGQTGRSMIVPVYQSMIQDIHRLFPNTTTVSNMIEPSEVESLRKTILRARDLIDIFSPIFPNRSNVFSSSPETLGNRHHPAKWRAVNLTTSKVYATELDLWSILRAHLDVGYTIIGLYQDLDHSHINYTMHLSHRLRREILQWKNQFMQNATDLILIGSGNISLSESASTNDAFLLFLQMSRVDKHRQKTPSGYTHRQESRLFWRNVDPLPNADDCACSSLHRLIQKQQHVTRDYYQRAFAHESVEDEFAHTDFHNLRKILRCWIDEYNLLASLCDGSLNRRVIFPKNRTYVDAFIKARQLLGILNDDWNAYMYYTTRTVHPFMTLDGNNTRQVAVELWKRQVDTDWSEFQNWCVAVNLLDVVETMMPEKG